MPKSFQPLRLALLLACGFAPAAFADTLPPCSANYDAARDLFTPTRNNTSLDFDNPIKSQIVNQQCLLTVVSREQAARLPSASPRGPGPNGAAELVAGRYVIYLSNGGDGGSGGSARFEGGIGGGGGGGGAGARQIRHEVVLEPGTYKLTLGAGGPGGPACRGSAFGGGPGWGGSPSSIVRLSDGMTVAGVTGADSWQRPTRFENEKKAGVADGHGGSGPGKFAGGSGGHVDPGFATVAQSGAAPPGMPGKAGDAGGDVPGKPMRTGGGGGGGAGLGDGGDGAGDLEQRGRLVAITPPEVGGLGAGGGGGAGRVNFCSAGAPGGNGYIALRRG